MKLSQAGDREGKTGGGTSIGIITDTEEEASGGRLAALGLGAAGEEGGFMGGGDTVCSLPGERDLGNGGTARAGAGLWFVAKAKPSLIWPFLHSHRQDHRH